MERSTTKKKKNVSVCWVEEMLYLFIFRLGCNNFLIIHAKRKCCEQKKNFLNQETVILYTSNIPFRAGAKVRMLDEWYQLFGKKMFKGNAPVYFLKHKKSRSWLFEFGMIIWILFGVYIKHHFDLKVKFFCLIFIFCE